MKRDQLITYINRLLKVEPDKDPYLFNGLQVIGSDQVNKICLGVSASAQLFEKSADWGAGMIILHHGLFGPKWSAPITKVIKGRLKILFDHDITLLTYHLFLDNHPKLGNNAQIIKRLKATKMEKFGYESKLYWGWQARFSKAVELETFKSRCQEVFGPGVKIFPYGPKTISKFAVVTGGGPYLVEEAADANLDAYITGEAKESTQAFAKEAGINYVYPGHYNSEKLGILALGEAIKKTYPELEIKFIDLPNSL